MENKISGIQKNYLKIPVSRSAILAVLSLVFLLVICAFGEGISGSFGANPSCFKYLGCTDGFFGYDALEHLLSGVSLTLIIIWFFRKFPKYSLFGNIKWKNVFIILSLIALYSIIWELVEFAHDAFRLVILHEPLLNLKLNINFLDQPSNTDTMGDTFFEMLGSIVILFFAKI